MAQTEGEAARIARLEAQVEGIRAIADERARSLREMDAMRVRFADLQSQELRRAIDKAENAQAGVNAGQNEFRAAIKDTQANFPARTEFNALSSLVATCASKTEVDRIVERVQTIERSEAKGAGRAVGMSAATSLLFQMLAQLIGVVTIIVLLKH